MKKVLMLASVASMIDQFNMVNIEILRNQGYEVHVATNFDKGSTTSKKRVEAFKNELKQIGIYCYQVDFSRKVKDILSNIKAYQQVKELMLKYDYEFVHCHSPIGGVCGRIAAHRTNTKSIYTAHGFHFYKGAPIKNWMLFYPIEKYLAKYTDLLITINKDDYKIVKEKNFKAKKIAYIPGIGIDLEKFNNKNNFNILKKRKELKISENDFVMLSVGELNNNKNHELVIRAISKIDTDKNIKYLIAGKGGLEKKLDSLIKELKINDKVKILGFRNDIAELIKISDVYIMPSHREGLPVSVMEAMAIGKPCIVSKIRGNIDLITENRGGIYFDSKNIDDCKNSIIKIINSKNILDMGIYNTKKIKEFSTDKVNEMLKKEYQDIIKKEEQEK